MNIVEYRRAIDPLVNPQAFKSNWPVAAHTAVHFLLCTAVSLWVGVHIEALAAWQWFAIALFTGHSVACLGLCAHEIGHGVLTRHKGVMYVWESLAWMYPGTICVSIHRKAHMLHHVYTNDRRDPNARPTRDEVNEDAVSAAVSEWLFPNAKHPWASAFMGLWLVNLVYQMKLLFASLLRTGTRYDCKIPRKQAWMGMGETFVLNLGLYVGLWAAGGFSWAMLGYLFVMNYVGTVIGLMYICTNHLLNPSYHDHVDPLELTLTVVVKPRWLDALHQKFSHHNEHHLYPHAGPANYQVIREALKATYPERYNEFGFFEAYLKILESPLARHDRTSLVDGSGTDVRPTVLPAMNPAVPQPEPAVATPA